MRSAYTAGAALMFLVIFMGSETQASLKHYSVVADTMMTPAPGDPCAALIPALILRQSGLTATQILKDTAETAGALYKASVPPGRVEVYFSRCTPKPILSYTALVWIDRSRPVTLTLSDGPIRWIRARLENGKQIITAEDRLGRQVREDFNPEHHPIDIGIWMHDGKMSAGFGVSGSDYCASVIESKSGPTLKWCGD